MADKVILVTERSRRAFRERYPQQPTEKFILIPNGCELADFENIKPDARNMNNKKFTILHAGSLNESKVWGRSAVGLFQAVHRIMREDPELAKKIRMVFAGDLPKGHKEKAKELGINSQIVNVGHIEHKKVLAMMSSARYYCLQLITKDGLQSSPASSTSIGRLVVLRSCF